MQRSLPTSQDWYIEPINKWFFKQGRMILKDDGLCLGVAGLGMLYSFLEEIKPGSINLYNDYYYLIDDYKTHQNSLIKKINQARIKLADLKLRETAIDLAWVKMQGTGCNAKERKQLNDDQNKQLNEWIQEEWERLLENAVNDGSLTKEDVQLTELPVLFEGIHFFYKVKKFLGDQALIPKRKSEFPSKSFMHIMPRGLEKHDGIVEVGSFNGAYTSSLLIKYLSSLRHAIENANPPFTHNVGLGLININHAININYDSRTKSWIVIDANYLPAKWLTDEEAAQAILTGFSANQCTIFQTQVFVRGDHQQAFAPIFSQWQNDPVHNVSPQKAILCDSESTTWLYLAAETGDLARVRELLIDKSDVNKAINKKNTPLLAATLFGHLDVVIELIAAKANVNQGDFERVTPLHSAAREGYLEIFMKLINAGADVNQSDCQGFTALHRAAKKGHLDILNELLPLVVDVNPISNSGVTSLYIAVESDKLKIVEALANIGEVDLDKPGPEGTPLILAVIKKNVEMVDVLIGAGANLDITDTNGSTPLSIAARNGNLALVKKLIEAGADVEKANINNHTPLYIAISQNHLEMVKKLIAAGADVRTTTINGKSLIDIAKEMGHEDIRLVLKKAYQLECKKITIEKVNLAVKGSNIKEDRVEANDDNYLGWCENHVSFFNLSHNKTGHKRALGLSRKINCNDAKWREVRDAVNKAYKDSPCHKHSLSRYLMRYIKNTGESIHDLSENEFFEFRKKNPNIV